MVVSNKEVVEILSGFAQYFSILIMSGFVMFISSNILHDESNTLAKLAFMATNTMAGMAAIISMFSVLMYGSDVCKSIKTQESIIMDLYSMSCVLSGGLMGLSFVSYYTAVLLSVNGILDIIASFISLSSIICVSYGVVYVYSNPRLTINKNT